MTSNPGRLYALAFGLLVLFLSWAVIAARPWVTPPTSSQALAALARREQRVRAESIAVQRIVQRRWQDYRARLASRSLAAAPAPSVRVVTLPPLTITRTS